MGIPTVNYKLKIFNIYHRAFVVNMICLTSWTTRYSCLWHFVPLWTVSGAGLRHPGVKLDWWKLGKVTQWYPKETERQKGQFFFGSPFFHTHCGVVNRLPHALWHPHGTANSVGWILRDIPARSQVLREKACWEVTGFLWGGDGRVTREGKGEREVILEGEWGCQKRDGQRCQQGEKLPFGEHKVLREKKGSFQRGLD